MNIKVYYHFNPEYQNVLEKLDFFPSVLHCPLSDEIAP